MDRLNSKFGLRISKSQAFKLFASKKKGTFSCNDHIMYLMELGDAVVGAHDQGFDNDATFASSLSDFQGVLLARLNPQREDYL